MTDRRRSERRRPTADALAAAAAQRRRFAQQLHDETIQTLLTAIQDLEEAKQGMAGSPETAALAMQRSIDLLTGSVRQLRERANDYDPSPPVGLSLADGIRVLADQAARRGGFTSSVRVKGRAVWADDRVILVIVRELLANVAKHARASHVDVSLSAAPDQGMRIVVTDDGIGVTPEQMREALLDGHIGLPLIAARVQEQGGTFKIDGGAGLGTAATVILPAPSR